MVLSPKESSEHIVKNATYVTVVAEGIKNIQELIIADLKTKELGISQFAHVEHHPKCEDPRAANWIFVVDTLNFCFWTSSDETKYKVNGESGYFALCAAVNRAIKEGINITCPGYYANIDEHTLSWIFRSDDGETKIPLLKERMKCLLEVGNRLLEAYDGNFENCIKQCKNSAEKLVNIIVSEFPCYRDEADFAGERVSFYKRAQILIGDLWSCFRGKGLGKFTDLHKITMFADYRVPQVLVHFGAIEYTKELAEALVNDVIMESGDPMEVEIRGASIYIVEEIKKSILAVNDIPKSLLENCNSITIDHFLWNYRRQHAEELEYIPFHKVLNIYY